MVDKSVGVTFSEEMEEREQEEDCPRQQLNCEVNCRCFSGPFCQSSQGELHAGHPTGSDGLCQVVVAGLTDE